MINNVANKINIFSLITNSLLSFKINFFTVYGNLIIFFLILLGNSPFIGTIFPNPLILFLAGLIARYGYLKLWIIILLSIIASILGDVLGYLFGILVNKRINKKEQVLLIKKEHFEKTAGIVHEQTGKYLATGKLSPFVNSATTIMIGAHKVKFAKFICLDFAINAVLNTFFIVLGYKLGMINNFADNLDKFLILIIIVLLLLWFRYYFNKWLKKKLKID
ncbi:MAG: DedA family protein [Nanoarchaeota archaeon]